MSLAFDPDSRWGRRLLVGAAWLVRWILVTLGRTYRFQVVTGAEHLEALVTERQPVLLSFWHNRTFLASSHFYYHLLKRGFDITVLASHSRDGELVTQLARQWGLRVVRGSASRGGRAALRALHRTLVRDHSSPIMIPDGPKGPIYKFKVGVAVLAQTSGAPVLPLGLAAQRFFTLKSWDRLIVPWPFSRVTLAVDPPRSIPKDSTSDEVEAIRAELEATLDRLTAQAEAALGVRDPVR